MVVVLLNTKITSISSIYVTLKMIFFLDCVWNFFATSYTISSCDGICGTAKRLTASLQRPVTDQIFSAKDMLKFSEESINEIKFMYTLLLVF